MKLFKCVCVFIFILGVTMPCFAQTYRVKEVIDVGTLLLTNGYTVRLIGVDTKEEDDVSIEFVKTLLEGRMVQLDIAERDRAGIYWAQAFFAVNDTNWLMVDKDGIITSDIVGSGILAIIREDFSPGFKGVVAINLNAYLIEEGYAMAISDEQVEVLEEEVASPENLPTENGCGSEAEACSE